jgi:hypothetical protein
MITDYPIGWNPYDWHEHHKPNHPRWRVRAGMFEQRDIACKAFKAHHESMVDYQPNPFKALADLTKWERLKAAVTACEEIEI